MADKSPRQTAAKKVGKSIKEKRVDKKAKAAGNAAAETLSATKKR